MKVRTSAKLQITPDAVWLVASVRFNVSQSMINVKGLFKFAGFLGSIGHESPATKLGVLQCGLYVLLGSPTAEIEKTSKCTAAMSHPMVYGLSLLPAVMLLKAL